MRRTLTLAIVLLLLVSPALSAATPREARSKTIGKYLLAAGCAVFASSMVLMLSDQKTGTGYYQGMEVAYNDYKKPYLVGDILGVALFSGRRDPLYKGKQIAACECLFEEESGRGSFYLHVLGITLPVL